jgi:Pyruvate/2-oxoacid:ferredoxin oxidoreductase delta subunit
LVYGTIVDIEKMKPLVPGPGLMTYGSLRRPLVNLGCARVKTLGDVELISSSGLWNANDSIERMMCGAHLVGLHTAVQYHGHQLYGKIINGISEFLDTKGLKIDEIIGAAVNDIVSQEAHDAFMRERDVTDDDIRPVIDIETCTQCGLCANCIHGGISMEDGNPKTHFDLCVRCGVCESLCPVEAIVLEKT